MRRRRNGLEYPDLEASALTVADGLDDLERAEAIVVLAGRTLDGKSPYRPLSRCGSPAPDA